MAKVMISLVGGRPVPNIQAALHIRPDIQYFVVSKDSIGEGRDFEKTMTALPEALKPSPKNIKEVRPYSLQDTVKACQEIVASHANDSLIFNTTLGPKTMAFGAYDVAKALKAQGKSVDVCYLGHNGLVWVFQDIVEEVNIGLDQYFASYGWKVEYKPETSEKLQRLAQLLIRDIPVSTRLLSLLRANDRGKDRRTIHCKHSLSEKELTLLTEIEKLGVVSNVRYDNTTISWTICSAEDGTMLLSGDWLEYSVYQTAKSLQEKGRPLFYKCGWGVKDSASKGELDFASILGGQLVVASCKTEISLERRWLEELHSYAEQLGKGMCSGILVSTVSRCSRSEKQLDDYQRWAGERHIVLVLAEDLPNLAAILRKTALADPKAEPADIPCYPRI